MPREARTPSSFYSPTNYLSPLERKRLRAIENEPLPIETKTGKTTSKRTSKKSAPKRRDNVGKTQPSGKRKRSSSDSSRVAKAKSSRERRLGAAGKASSADDKTLVIPLSLNQRVTPVPADAPDNSVESEPPAKKSRKFFSSGLRAPANMAVSWNNKVKLKVQPAIATLEHLPTRKELVMTVPFRPPNMTAEAATSIRNVGTASPKLGLGDRPDKHVTFRVGPQKRFSELKNKTASTELAVAVPSRQPQAATVASTLRVDVATASADTGPGEQRDKHVTHRAGSQKRVGELKNKTASTELAAAVPSRQPQAATVAATLRVDLAVRKVPCKLPEKAKGESTEMRDEKQAKSSTEVPHKPPNNTRAKSVPEVKDTEDTRTRTEISDGYVSPIGVETDDLEEVVNELSDACEPCSRVGDHDETGENHNSLMESDVEASRTELEHSITRLEAEANQSRSVEGTPTRDSSVRSFTYQGRHDSADCSLPLRRLRRNVQDSTDGRRHGELSLPLKALCPNIPDSPSRRNLLERPSTPPIGRTGSPNKQSLYPIFSTPTSKCKKSTKLQHIPTSPIEAPKKRFMPGSSDPAQLIIDAGQKKFGHTMCPTCGMVYTIGDADDEKLHVKHHRTFVAVMKFPGWKNQREVGLYPDGKVIMVSPNDPKNMLNKMDEIRQMVDRELGILADGSAPRVPQMYFVFVSYTKTVLGFLSAQEIKQGYRMIPGENGQSGYCCEVNPTPAVCGVSRIWTAPFYRRKKVASRLLDRLRMNFSFGCPIESRKIAFSDPTLMGRELAAAYTRNDRFLVFCP